LGGNLRQWLDQQRSPIEPCNRIQGKKWRQEDEQKVVPASPFSYFFASIFLPLFARPDLGFRLCCTKLHPFAVFLRKAR
jgi:hypothetical protein